MEEADVVFRIHRLEEEPKPVQAEERLNLARVRMADVAITEAAIRERSDDTAEVTVEGMKAIELRPISAGNPDAFGLAAGGREASSRPVSRTSPDYYFHTSFVARTLGKYDGAAQILTEGLRFHVGNFRLLLNRGYVNFKMSKFESALSDFVAALASLRSQQAALNAPSDGTSVAIHNPLHGATNNPSSSLRAIVGRQSGVSNVRPQDAVSSPQERADILEPAAAASLQRVRVAMLVTLFNAAITGMVSNA